MLDFSELFAANEDDYRYQRHRTSPISSTIYSIPNYPKKLRIYLTHASPYWQVCCFFKGKTYKRSLKTTIRQVAIRAAKDFFHQSVADLYGTTINIREDRALLFGDLVAPTIAIETARTQRGEYSAAGLNILRNRLHKSVEPHFGKMPIDKVGYNEISEFVQLLSKLKKSPTTIQQHIVATRKVLNYAYANNYIKHLPKFPSVKINSIPRGSFNLSEYKLLVQTAKRYVHTKIVDPTKSQRKRGRFHMEPYLTISPELQWLIRFMVNSFIRPSDIKNLQHQHITVVRNEHTYLRMNLPKSKKHDKPIVTIQSAVPVYEQLKKYHALNGRAEPTDYLFFPELRDRTDVLMLLGCQFMFVQNLAKIEVNAANGRRRTLYSLRHTAITFRLLYGGSIDLLTLARNARTSVEMVEKFYSSNLTSEMNIDLLQGKRKKSQ
jgi:integrase